MVYFSVLDNQSGAAIYRSVNCHLGEFVKTAISSKKKLEKLSFLVLISRKRIYFRPTVVSRHAAQKRRWTADRSSPQSPLFSFRCRCARYALTNRKSREGYKASKLQISGKQNLH